MDATVRTLVRLKISRRCLLEWETAAAAERRLENDLPSFVVSMWPASALAAVIGLAVAWIHPATLAAAGPILAAWLFSPVVAWWVSQPRRATEAPLTDDERNALRRVARRTWYFFETFVGDADHWLPPDNYQEEPEGRVAHRTSPTNMGLLLLSTLAAHDFGYIGLRLPVEATGEDVRDVRQAGAAPGPLLQLVRHEDPEPAAPDYISTVDSGNLMGCLVALKQGLIEKAEEPVLGLSLRRGLADTLGLFADALRARGGPPPRTRSSCSRPSTRTSGRSVAIWTTNPATCSAGTSGWAS